MRKITATAMIGYNKETAMSLHVAALILPDEIAGELDKMRGRYRRQMQYLTTAHISLYPFSVETDPAAVLEALKSTAARTRTIPPQVGGCEILRRAGQCGIRSRGRQPCSHRPSR